MKKLLAILRMSVKAVFIAAKVVFIAVAFLACVAALGVMVCVGYQMLSMGTELLRVFGIIMLAFSLAETLYLVALVRIGYMQHRFFVDHAGQPG